jgi:hypothetical protein
MLHSIVVQQDWQFTIDNGTIKYDPGANASLITVNSLNYWQYLFNTCFKYQWHTRC